MIIATCGHQLTKKDGEDGMGYGVAIKAYARDGCRAVDYITVCRECRDYWLTSEDFLAPGNEDSWLLKKD